MAKKQMHHLYKGSWDQFTDCEVCGKPAPSVLHMKNGGTVCDAADWPCACGAWHDSGEMDQKIHMANTNYEEWLRKIGMPGYVLTREDQDILAWLET